MVENSTHRRYTSPTSNIYALNAARYAWAFIFTMFNMETFFHVGLALTSTYVTSSAALNIRYKLDSFFISLAIISPLMYSLRAAFYRRETAAKSMAALKAACLAYYLTMRDWNRVPKGSMHYVGDNNSPMAKEVYAVVHKFLHRVVRYIRFGMGNHESLAEVHISHMSPMSWFFTLFQSKVDFDAIHKYHTDEEKGAFKEHLEQEGLNDCYEALSELNMWNERALVSWGYERPGDAAISSRSNSHIRYIVFAFEELRLAREYRTPVMLRYGCRILIVIYAIFMGPYFNSTCDSFEVFERQKLMGGHGGAHHPHGAVRHEEGAHYHDGGFAETPSCYVNYIGTTLFFVSVALLARAAKDVEFPFNRKGLDDLFFDSDQELEGFVRLPGDEEFKKRVMGVVVEPTLSKDRENRKKKENKETTNGSDQGGNKGEQKPEEEGAGLNNIQVAGSTDQKMDHETLTAAKGVLPAGCTLGHESTPEKGVLPAGCTLGHESTPEKGVLPMDNEIGIRELMSARIKIGILRADSRMGHEARRSMDSPLLAIPMSDLPSSGGYYRQSL